MDWSLRRQLIYALAIAIILATVTVLAMRDNLFPKPTCSDKKMNGPEEGVDCGGVCNLRCSEQVRPLTVEWSKAVMVEEGVYDLVAMNNNANIDNASKQIGFSFILYDKLGTVLGIFSGSTTAPLGGEFPIILPSIALPSAPDSVITTLNDGPHYKVNESPSSPTVRIGKHRYEQDTVSRVFATVSNTKRIELNKLPIRAVLFDNKNNAYAVGETLIPYLDKEGVVEIVFTWRNVLPVAPTRIEVYPIFNPFNTPE